MPHVVYVTSRAPFGDAESFVLAEATALVGSGTSVSLFPAHLRASSVVHERAMPWIEQAKRVAGFKGLWARRSLRDLGEVLVLLTEIVRRSLPNMRHLAVNLASLVRGLQLAAFVRTTRATHIHACWASAPAMVALVAARLSGVSWSFTGHRWDVEEDNVLSWKIAEARRMRVISRSTATTLVRRWPAFSSKIVSIYLGTHVEALPNSSSAEPRIVAIGRLIPLKRHGDLIEAISRLRARGQDVHCDLIGSGELEEQLLAQIKSLDLDDHVHLVGGLPHEQVLARLRAGEWRCLVQTSEIEGIPVAVMEAMEAGVVVIATAAGATSELVSPATGWLVPIGEPEQLANAIAQALSDDESVGEKRRRARALIESEFDIERNARCLVHEVMGLQA